MVNRKDINFTTGNIMKQLILFAIPIIAGEILQNLYNSVDSIVVGNFASEAALAAVGVCGSLTQLLVGFFNGMSVGSTVVVSKAFGKSDADSVARSTRYTFSFSVFLGLVLTGIALILSGLLVRVTGANEEIFPEALIYFRIYLCGLTFTVAYNSGAGILRAMGDTKTPFMILTVSSVVNIVLDLLLTALLGWGVAGVAIATVICQGISAVIVFRKISGRIGASCLDIPDTLKHGMSVVKEAMSIGFWAGMQSALIQFSNLFVWRYINRFDTLSVAGVSIGLRLDKFVNLPVKSYGMAMTTFVGQNRGAKNQERIRQGFVKCLLLSFATFLLFASILYAGCGKISSWFNDNQVVIETSVRFIRTIVPFYFLMAVREIVIGLLRGFEKSTWPMVATLAGMVGVRQLYLFLVFRKAEEIRFIFYVYPIGWGCAALFLLFYAWIVRKELKVS